MFSKEIRNRTGASRDTLRHYVDIGLLHPHKNSVNGYSEFSEKDYETLSFALRAKDLGFSLEDIKNMETKISQASCPHQSILPNLTENLSKVKRKITDLKLVEKHLKKLIADFEKRNCKKHPTKFEI